MTLFKRSLKSAVAAGLLVLGLGSAAMAQEAEMQQIIDRLERMDRDIKSLNLKVYRSAPAANLTQTQSGETLDGPLAARMSVRIGELENQMRQMTGQLEEMAYRVSQITTRMDKLVADVDYRLTALEGGNNVIRPSSPPVGQADPNMTMPTMKAGELPPPGIPESSLVKGPGEQPAGSLGTLSGQDMQTYGEDAPAQTTGTPAAGAQGAPDLTSLSPQDLYNTSRQKLLRGAVSEAETGFNMFLDKNPTHELAGNVRYWLGETYYVQQNFNQAAATFLEGYQKSPRGPKAPDSLLKLGMSLNNLNKKEQACRTYGQLRASFPKMPAHLSKTLERERSKADCK